MGEDYDDDDYDDDDSGGYDETTSIARHDDTDEESPRWKGKQKLILGSLMSVLALIGIVVVTQMIISFARAPGKSAPARGSDRSGSATLEVEATLKPEETTLPERTPATRRRPPPEARRATSPSPKRAPRKKKKKNGRKGTTLAPTSASSEAQDSTSAIVGTNEGERPTEAETAEKGESKLAETAKNRNSKLNRTGKIHAVTPRAHPRANKAPLRPPREPKESSDTVTSADAEDPFTLNDFRE